MIIHGDALTELKKLNDKSINCCVTSPPYWGLRDYGIKGQFGLERTPAEYIRKLVFVFREVRRLMKDNGILWIVIGDTYATGAGHARVPGGKHLMSIESFPKCQPNRLPLSGLKPKDLVGIPWMLAFALRNDGWYLRQDIIWHKPNPIPTAKDSQGVPDLGMIIRMILLLGSE
jgi:DNA modification methylase